MFWLCLNLLLSNPSPLTINSDFPGGSAEVVEINSQERIVSIRPSPHPKRGWLCWWYFELKGVQPGEKLTLQVTSGSRFAFPDQPSLSVDNKVWVHGDKGKLTDKTMTYTVTVPETVKDSLWLAWGPPYLLADAEAAVKRVADADIGASSFVLCESRDGHKVPGVRWQAEPKLPGIWIQARQHAWESGGSWVCQGVLDFLSSDDPDAVKLRQSAHIVVVPIMDVDNVQRGAGGKNGIPQDHNRDWSDDPHWPEVAAAQKQILQMEADGGFRLFLDLHNPAAGDKIPFFFGPPDEQNPATRKAYQERFFSLAQEHLGKEPLKLNKSQRISGANYDKNWQKISKNWVAEHTSDKALAFTLETSWNTPNSTADGYRAYGRALGKTVAEYFLTQE